MIHAGLHRFYCVTSFNEMWTDTTRCTRSWKIKDKTFLCKPSDLKKNRFFFSSGNWTLCLKDKFGDDFIVQACLKYRMGKTGLISAYIIKCIPKWQGLNINETNMHREVEKCNKCYAEMLEVKLNFFFAHCFIHYSH